MKLVNATKLTETTVSVAPYKLSAWEKISAFKWMLLAQNLFLTVIFGGIGAVFVALPDEPLPKGSHNPIDQLALTMAASGWMMPTLCVAAILLFGGLNVLWVVKQDVATIGDVAASNLELAEKYR